MATITERNGKYRAVVRKQGVSKSATFDKKSEAQAWAKQLETLIINGEYDDTPKSTFADLLDRYLKSVTREKRGKREETYRILRIARSPLGQILLEDLKKEHFRTWQNQRLQEVQSSSVIRERSTISAVLTQAIQWDLIKENPIRTLEKPKEAPARTRRYSQEEIDRLIFVSGFDFNHSPITQISRTGAALLFALETAMRAGEICSLTWQNINFDKRTAFLPQTKNGYSRTVPLSPKAVEILHNLAKVRTTENDLVFQTNTKNLDANFRKLKTRASLDNADLHFHDSRREALTRLSKIFGVMELAKISGHRDLSVLQNTYYAPDISELAAKMW